MLYKMAQKVNAMGLTADFEYFYHAVNRAILQTTLWVIKGILFIVVITWTNVELFVPAQ